MALHRFGLVAPELNRICDEFLSLNDISNFNRTRQYQLTGSMNLRIICNVNKLCSMMEIKDVTFADLQSVYNIVSKAVLSEQAESDTITHVAIGTEMYKTFLNERVTGERSIWEKMKKRKMLTFKSSGKTLKTKLEGKVVELKEDRSLMRRILVISQKRPEIDLPNLIGKYEFSIHRAPFSVLMASFFLAMTKAA